jgi:sortase A
VQRFFLVVGFVTLTYACGALAYAELYQRYEFWKFEHEFDTIEPAKNTAVVAKSLDLREGDLIGKLVISRIGISLMVFQGVQDDTLHLGAGHVPGTPLPGADGNSAIAAHRDTFFRKLQSVRAGDLVQFSSLRGASEYIVQSTEIVEPYDTRVIESRGLMELTLISCYPFYFVGAAPHRFIVHAIPAFGGAP